MLVTTEERFIDPFTDFAFKKLFGPDSSKSRLIDFLNTMLGLEKRVVEIHYLNNEQLGITEFDRKSVYDIFCQDETGNVFIIEIQRSSQRFFKDRSIFYSMFPIRSQARKGEWNFELKKVCSINILDFCFDDTHPGQMIHEVYLMDRQTKEVFCDRLSYLYIETPKFKKKENELITRHDMWMYALCNMKELLEIPLTLVGDSVFKELFMDAELAKLREAELEAYYASRKAEWDEFARIETALEKGKLEGRLEGIEQTTKERNTAFVKNLLQYTSHSVEEIAKLVNVSREFVLQIKQAVV